MKIFNIQENDAEQRLDKFLKKLFPNAVRSLIYKINRKGKVKINWKKKDNEYKLQRWDEVKIFLKDSDFDEMRKVEKKETFSKDKLEKKDIIYEDDDLLIINKNPGLNVHPGDHKTKETNLIYQVWDYLWDKLRSLTFKPSLIHRIDRDTSGAIMIAKNKNSLVKLSSDLKSKKISKTYLAIVKWRFPHKSIKLDGKLKRNDDTKNKVEVSAEWKNAVSIVKLIEKKSINIENTKIDFSILEINIETGRTHQIRVHLSNLGYPILWDQRYWDKSLNYFLSKKLSISRQMLHAKKLEFNHPKNWKKLKLEARLKKDIQKLVK